MSPESSGRRPRLDPAVVGRFRRERINRAMAAEVCRRGYRATTVTDVVRRAGIARNTFYQSFPNKEAVFIAVLEEGFAALAATARGACEETGTDPRARRRAALAAILGWVAENPEVAHCCLFAAPEGGARAMGMKLDAEADLAAVLAGTFGEGSPPGRLSEFLCGGVSFVLARLLVAGAAVEAPQRLDDLVGFLDLAEIRGVGAHR